MSNDLEDQELGRELGRELRRRSGQPGLHPVSLDEVVGRARRIKRRRQAATGLVAAAVLAVALPVGVNIVGTTSSTSPGFTDRLTPTATPGQLPAGAVVPLEPADAPPGDPSAVPYLLDHTLVRPDGSSLRLPEDYRQVGRLGDGWLALRFDDQGNGTADVLGGDGRVVSSFPADQGLATSPSADRVAVVERTPSGPVLRLLAGQGAEIEHWSFAHDVTIAPAGLLSGNRVVYNATTANGESVAMLASPGDTQPLSGLVAAQGTEFEAGLVTALTRVTDTGSCSAVVDVETQQRSAATCELTLGRFSADGHYLLGHPAYRDGIGDASVAIVDATTGRPVVTFERPGSNYVFVAETAWEDETHVLATVYDHDAGGWFLLRLGADGSVENVTGSALPGEDVDAPVGLTVQP